MARQTRLRASQIQREYEDEAQANTDRAVAARIQYGSDIGAEVLGRRYDVQKERRTVAEEGFRVRYGEMSDEERAIARRRLAERQEEVARRARDVSRDMARYRPDLSEEERIREDAKRRGESDLLRGMATGRNLTVEQQRRYDELQRQRPQDELDILRGQAASTTAARRRSQERLDTLLERGLGRGSLSALTSSIESAERDRQRIIRTAELEKGRDAKSAEEEAKKQLAKPGVDIENKIAKWNKEREAVERAITEEKQRQQSLTEKEISQQEQVAGIVRKRREDEIKTREAILSGLREEVEQIRKAGEERGKQSREREIALGGMDLSKQAQVQTAQAALESIMQSGLGANESAELERARETVQRSELSDEEGRRLVFLANRRGQGRMGRRMEEELEQFNRRIAEGQEAQRTVRKFEGVRGQRGERLSQANQVLEAAQRGENIPRERIEEAIRIRTEEMSRAMERLSPEQREALAATGSQTIGRAEDLRRQRVFRERGMAGRIGTREDVQEAAIRRRLDEQRVAELTPQITTQQQQIERQRALQETERVITGKDVQELIQAMRQMMTGVYKERLAGLSNNPQAVSVAMEHEVKASVQASQEAIAKSVQTAMAPIMDRVLQETDARIRREVQELYDQAVTRRARGIRNQQGIGGGA
jgi:hypothetical protein